MFKYSETTEIENNAVQGNTYRLGEVRKHVASHVYVTQVDNRSISPEEKFGYLLEMVSANFRARFANLKPGEEGYKVAWKRLKAEYGQDKLVVNAHLEEIMNPPIVKRSN